ncbi:MAG TPA: amino acid permease [Gemmatimonadaceae bacterium]|nr:amino acid permease [Gemmatimonadaceae bacterium]
MGPRVTPEPTDGSATSTRSGGAGSGAGRRPELPRRLGLWEATLIVIGVTIGSGIFRVPASVADTVGSPLGVATVWIAGGIISLCGALALAELAAAFPEPGGVFVYLREVYGPAVAFLFGWMYLFIGPTGIAAVALVFGEYLGTLVGLSSVGVRLAAAGAIAVVAAASYRSVRGASAMQGVATLGKVAALAGIVVAALLLGDGSTGTFGAGAPVPSASPWSGVGLGLVAALWAYNGMQDMLPLAGEVRDPGRALPRALLAGTAIVVAIYLAANAAYLYVLPYTTLRASPLVASDAMVRVMGPIGAAAVAAAVMVSTFGTVNALALTQPRVYYAMADAGLLFRPLARVHSHFATPHVAIIAYAAVAIIAVWVRSFEQLTEAFVLGVWPFLALAVAGVLVLRRTRPELVRPYHTPLYPVVPLIFIGGTLWVVGSALVARPVTTLTGIGLTLVGLPVYALWRRARHRR